MIACNSSWKIILIHADSMAKSQLADEAENGAMETLIDMSLKYKIHRIPNIKNRNMLRDLVDRSMRDVCGFSLLDSRIS